MLTLHRCRATLAILAFVGLCIPSLAHAQTETFAFTDQVTSVSDPFGVLNGSINVGQTFSGFYTFNLSTPNALGPDPVTGIYLDDTAPYGFAPFTLGSYTLQSDTDCPNCSQFEIDVLNNDPIVGDGYTVQDANFETSGGTFVDVGGSIINLTDSTGTAFSSDALPPTPPNLSSFDGNLGEIVFQGLGGNAYVDVTTTSLTLVPERRSLLLMCSGMLPLGLAFGYTRLRRRRA